MDETRKPKPYQVGVQIPCGVYPQVPQKNSVWGTAAAFGRGIPQVGGAKGLGACEKLPIPTNQD
jgi:hypothetical protein